MQALGYLTLRGDDRTKYVEGALKDLIVDLVHF